MSTAKRRREQGFSQLPNIAGRRLGNVSGARSGEVRFRVDHGVGEIGPKSDPGGDGPKVETGAPASQKARCLGHEHLPAGGPMVSRPVSRRGSCIPAISRPRPRLCPGLILGCRGCIPAMAPVSVVAMLVSRLLSRPVSMLESRQVSRPSPRCPCRGPAGIPPVSI